MDPLDLQAQVYVTARLAGIEPTSEIAKALIAILDRHFPPARPPHSRTRNKELREKRAAGLTSTPKRGTDFGYSEQGEYLWIVRAALPGFKGMPPWKAATSESMFDASQTLSTKLREFTNDEHRFGAWRSGQLRLDDPHSREKSFLEGILGERPVSTVSHLGTPWIDTKGGIVRIGIRSTDDVAGTAASIANAEESLTTQLANAMDHELMVAALIGLVVDVNSAYAAAMRDDSRPDEEPVFRAAEHTIRALGAGNVRDALFALARRGLIRRVGDDVEISSAAYNAIIRHVRRGEPHDSWHYRAIEHACGNITHIEPEEARRVLARMEKSFTLAMAGVEEESKARAVRTARALLATIARAQRRVTPSFSNDYPIAAVHLARVGAFDEALTVLRTYAVARNERYGENDDPVARTIVMGFALEAGNHNAFAACLRDGLHLFLQRRGKERRAAPLLDQWLRQGIQASVESGVTDLVRRTMDEVVAAEPPLTRESIAAALQSLLPDDSDAFAQAKAETT